MTAHKLKIGLPDLISNSYFPAVAAVELGCFDRQNIDAEIELIFPVDQCYHALKQDQIQLVAGSAHSALAAFPEWEGVRLLCAQAQGMYWFLVVRPDMVVNQNDLSMLKNCSIGAAPWVEMGLRGLLAEAGIDIAERNIRIGPVPGAKPVPGQIVNFGVTAAQALADGKIDGFWANGMGTEVAVTTGAGKILLDVRRGDGPRKAFDFTMASIAATTDFIDNNPDLAAGAVRALREAQQLLASNPSCATDVARKYFPERETGLIAQIIARDVPYLSCKIEPEFVKTMNGFARSMGILTNDRAYEDVVATGFSELW